MKWILFCVLAALLGVSACKKANDSDAIQARKDDSTIQAFMTSKSIVAQKHSSGLYYIISSSGTGSAIITGNTLVKVSYKGRLLNGTIFDQGTITTQLGVLIEGWKIGVPLIQKGGRIRLLIPSGLAYGPKGQGSIAPNTVLDFDIDLLDVTN